jgi:hypothetical protein
MRRFEAALRSAINTPHEPLKEKPGPRQNWERYDPKTNTWQDQHLARPTPGNPMRRC